MPPTNADLPASVAAIARLIGRDRALALAGACNNGRIYVPKAIAPDHRIAQAIGAEASAIIARYYGGEIIYLAKQCRSAKIRTRNDSIRRLFSEGKTRTEIAVLVGLTRQMIGVILRENTAT